MTREELKTDGIYRYAEDPPPKRAEKEWEQWGRVAVRLGSGLLLAAFVSASRKWGYDWWLVISVSLIALVLVNLLVDIIRTQQR